jgi:hypothetical protein
MSRRHRDSGRAVTTKDDRLAEHRRDRRAARQKIVSTVEPDDAVLPGEGHTHLHAHRPTAIEPKPTRHWKLPFWKRRNAMRTQRAMAERLLAQQE